MKKFRGSSYLISLRKTSHFTIVCSRCSFGKSVGNKRFQNRLFFQFEGMSACNDKKEVILVFNHDVGEIITVAAEASYDFGKGSTYHTKL